MTWEHYARHKCGKVHRVPFGNTSFLTNFGQICSCGSTMNYHDLEKFIGREVYRGKLFKPSTWFKWEIVDKAICSC